MAYSCIIIEDQLPAQRILIRYIEDIPELELKETFTDPLAALAFLRQNNINLIFLDIHLPKISGMDFLSLIPYKPKVILTTAFSEYALESYEFDVIDYLLKPISFERFLKAVSKVIYPEGPEHAAPGQPPAQASFQKEIGHVFVKSDRSIVKIETDTICFIRAEDDYTRLITTNKNYFLSYTLKYWEDLLPQGQFFRIHKSFIINMDYVEKIEGNRVFVSGSKEALPIGRTYRDDFMGRIEVKD